MGLKVRYNGGVLDLSDAKYNPNGYGTKRLKIRTGPGSNDVKEYGLATSASYASDKWLKFNVNGQQHYIATSKSSTRQSNNTSYSSYYTYTYTQSYPRSSVLTRQGTQTTYTYTEPARYTYRATYYTGKVSYYTVSTINNGATVRTVLLSGTRSSNYNATRTASRASTYTAYYSGYSSIGWQGNMCKVTYKLPGSWKFNNSQFGYANTHTRTSALVQTVASTTSNAYNNQQPDWNASWTDSFVGGGTYTSSNPSSKRVTTTGLVISRTFTGFKTGNYKITTPVTATRSSQYNSEYAATRASTYYATPPNYVAMGNQLIGVAAGGTYTVNAANYVNSTSQGTYSEGFVNNVSYRSVSYSYRTSRYNSATAATGNATLTSTNTPIGGVPSNYTLYAGPSVINSYASYTYTNQYCTRTYASNYSTSYWTEYSTYTSNNWLYSSLGSTVYTTSSAYTEHNFV